MTFIQFSILKSSAFMIDVVDKPPNLQAFNDAIFTFGFTQSIHFQLFIFAAIVHATCVQCESEVSGIGSLSLFTKSYQCLHV
jgi:hypothetical protein